MGVDGFFAAHETLICIFLLAGAAAFVLDIIDTIKWWGERPQ